MNIERIEIAGFLYSGLAVESKALVLVYLDESGVVSNAATIAEARASQAFRMTELALKQIAFLLSGDEHHEIRVQVEFFGPNDGHDIYLEVAGYGDAN